MYSDIVSTRLQHLYQTAHLLAPLLPNASKYVSKKMRKLAKSELESANRMESRWIGNLEPVPNQAAPLAQSLGSNGINRRVDIATSVLNRSCQGCGMIWIPGQTCQVRIRRGRRKRNVVYTCMICGEISRYPIGVGKDDVGDKFEPKVTEMEPLKEEKQDTVIKNIPVEQPKPAAKRKKEKIKDLKSLLAQKPAATPSPSMKLTDFLKDLQ